MLFILLFQTLKGSRTENALLKAKNGRLQDENISKSKKIEELLSPDTQVVFLSVIYIWCTLLQCYSLF